MAKEDAGDRVSLILKRIERGQRVVAVAGQEKLLLSVSLTQVAYRGNHVFAARIDAARPFHLAGTVAATSQIESQNR